MRSSLDEDLVKDTMSVILKYEADIRKAQQELSRMMTKPDARAGWGARRAGAAPQEGHAPLTGELRPRRRGACSARSSSSRICSARAACASRSPRRSTPSRHSTSCRSPIATVFRDALRASLVKRGDDIATYDQLFDLYWSGFYDNLKNAFDSATGSLGEQGIDVEQLLEQIRQMLESGQMPEGEIDLSELARALLTGDLNQLEQMIRAAAAQAGAARIENMLQIGFFSRRTMESLGAEGAANELRELAARLRAAGMGDAEAEAIGKLAERFFEALRKSVRDFMERELQTRNFDYMEKFRREALFEKSFYSLTEDEIARMREVVNRLAQKIKNVMSIRRKRRKKGKLDLHTMLRRNAGHGGVPFELVFKEKRKDRPKLVILCDVSSSVANVSRFMLQFVYSLQECFTKIRAFVFVAELGEVTPVFQDHDVSKAIEEALEGGGVINVYTRSQLRHGLPHLLARLPLGRRRQDDRADPRRRAQQLQRPEGLVPARPPHEGQERDLAEPGEPERVGLRRLRDGQVPAVHDDGGGVSQPPPALAGRRQARAVTRRQTVP